MLRNYLSACLAILLGFTLSAEGSLILVSGWVAEGDPNINNGWAATEGTTVPAHTSFSNGDSAQRPSLVNVTGTAATFADSTNAYRFDGVNDRLSGGSFHNQADDYGFEPTTSGAVFDIYFSLNDYIGNHTIFETGGTTDGLGLVLLGSELRYGVNDNANNATSARVALTTVDLVDLITSPTLGTDYFRARLIVKPASADNVGDGSISLQVTTNSNTGSLFDQAVWKGVDWAGGDGTGVSASSAGTTNEANIGGNSLIYPGADGSSRFLTLTESVTAFDGEIARINYQVPEPSTYIVFTGLILCFGLAGWWRKRRRAAA